MSGIGGTTPLDVLPMLPIPRSTQSQQIQPMPLLQKGARRPRGPGAMRAAHLTGGTALAFLVNGRANPLQRRGDRTKPGGSDNPYNVPSSWCKHTWQDGEQNNDHHEKFVPKHLVCKSVQSLASPASSIFSTSLLNVPLRRAVEGGIPVLSILQCIFVALASSQCSLFHPCMHDMSQRRVSQTAEGSELFKQTIYLVDLGDRPQTTNQG